MQKLITIAAVAAFLGVSAAAPPPAYGESGWGDISSALSRLKKNPRYQGRIIGTHVKPAGDQYLYEVRILRPDDRVILVYIDPDTGRVIGDSERRQTVLPGNRAEGRDGPNRAFGKQKQPDDGFRRGYR
ncbi:MAG: PepSY domain-containing protein [Alphaproteobacteria bacterium]